MLFNSFSDEIFVQIQTNKSMLIFYFALTFFIFLLNWIFAIKRFRTKKKATTFITDFSTSGIGAFYLTFVFLGINIINLKNDYLANRQNENLVTGKIFNEIKKLQTSGKISLEERTQLEDKLSFCIEEKEKLSFLVVIQGKSSSFLKTCLQDDVKK